ncbi:MAG: hypothetical protein MAG453_00063 [Calditrichaeota bacterium]|nr:hypothetical protein [Calditrichota bacterium]
MPEAAGFARSGAGVASALVAETLIRENPGRAIKLIERANSGEPAIARNSGLIYARGEYLLPLDADDCLLPDTLVRLLAAAEPFAAERVVAYGFIQCFGAHRKLWKNTLFHPNALLRKNKLPNTSLLSRSLADAVGGYPERVPGYEDWAFWIGCANAGARFVQLPEPVYMYRASANEGMGKAAERMHEWVVANLFRRYPDLYEDEELAWAEDYLRRHPDPPDVRERHGPADRFPWAAAMLIAATPKLYAPDEIRWAASYLERNPRPIRRGLPMKKPPVQVAGNGRRAAATGPGVSAGGTRAE